MRPPPTTRGDELSSSASARLQVVEEMRSPDKRVSSGPLAFHPIGTRKVHHGKSSCQFGDQCANRAGLGAHSRLQRLAELASGVAKSVIEGGAPSISVGCMRPDPGRTRRSASGCSNVGPRTSLQLFDPRTRLPWRTIGHLAIAPGPDGNRTFAEWSASFDADPPEKRAETEDFIGNGCFRAASMR